jgi:ABC-type Fe3+/spermidine/putrescine transport system ATPase subunit
MKQITSGQFRSQLRSQLGRQLVSQLGSQLGNQSWNQLDDQLRSQLESQLMSQLQNVGVKEIKPTHSMFQRIVMFFKSLFILTLFISCGKTEIVTKDVEIGPDFKKAAKFCDDRYGKKTEESEQCFLDYREYFDIELELNTKIINIEDIIDFCEDNYVQPIEIINCIEQQIEGLSS